MNQLEKMLLEKDIEQSISVLYKDNILEYNTKSMISNKELYYENAQLMAFFALNTELQVQEILKIKYGNRVELLGGINPADILINGTNLAFNVKTYNIETSSIIKLCSKSSIDKLKDYDYRFILICYKLSENRKQIISQDVYVFNYDDIKDAISIWKDSILYITLNKILQYKENRDAFVNGESSKFKKITEAKKDSIDIEELKEYLYEKNCKLTIEQLKVRYAKKNISTDNIEYVLKMLIDAGCVKNSGNYYFHKDINIEYKKKSDIFKEQYDLFIHKKIKDVNDMKDFRRYLADKYDFNSKNIYYYMEKTTKEDKEYSDTKGEINVN